MIEKVLSIVMAGLLLGSIGIGIIGTIYHEFRIPFYAGDHVMSKIYASMKEPSFEEALKVAQAKISELINPQERILNDLLKKIEESGSDRESAGERKVSVEDWTKQFKEGAEEGSGIVKDTWLTGKHLIEGKWKKPKPHPPKHKPPRPEPPSPPTPKAEVTGMKSVIEGTKTYIYIRYEAQLNAKLEYLIRLAGLYAIKPEEELIDGGLVRLVVDGEKIDMTYSFTMEMLATMKPKLIVWFEDKYGRPISEKPYEFDLRPVTLMIDLHGTKWYIVHRGKMYEGSCPETDVILMNIERSAVFSRILPPG